MVLYTGYCRSVLVGVCFIDGLIIQHHYNYVPDTVFRCNCVSSNNHTILIKLSAGVKYSYPPNYHNNDFTTITVPNPINLVVTKKISVA